MLEPINSDEPIKVGRKSNSIYLSYECLKEMMMLLQTEKSQVIRRQYILQEALFSACSKQNSVKEKMSAE